MKQQGISGNCFIRLAAFVLLVLVGAGCAGVTSSTVSPSTIPSSSASAIHPPSSGENPTKARIGQHTYSSKVQIESMGHIPQTVEVNYLLYLPDSFGKDPGRMWPLILFLHESGARGNDLELLKEERGLPAMLDGKTEFPFLVLSPQLPRDLKRWSNMIDPLKVLLEKIVTTYCIDPRRVYLTGLSMGGFGTWEFALRYPHQFAAIVPIAGGYRYGSDAIPENICSLKDLPVWAFHGAIDSTVRPAQSEDMIKVLETCGGNGRLTLYPDAGHVDSLKRAYADPKLYNWLLAQKLR